MLVLTRKKNEAIQVGPDVTIYVVEIRGDKVRLGIDAPKEVVVLCGELNGVEELRNQKPD